MKARMDGFIRSLKDQVSRLSEIVESPAVDFKVGDKVTFRNYYGVKFNGHRILAISKDSTLSKYGEVVFIDCDCYWCPVHPDRLTLESE